MPSKTPFQPPRPRRRAASLGLIALSLIALVGIWQWLAQRNRPLPIAAELRVLQGQAIVSRADAGQDPPYTAGAATRLQRGDEVHTSADGQAELDFGEGETIALGPQAHLIILELYRSPIVRGLMASLALEQGKVIVRLPRWRPEGMRVAIETRIATVEASGTAFQCEVLDKERIEVIVQEGKVTVSMGEQSLTLQAGQAVEARLGQPLVAIGAPALPSPIPTPSRSGTAQTPPSQAIPTATATLTDLQKTLFPPARTPTRPGDDRIYYTVQPGDTLYSIARRYGLPWEAIWEANKATLPRPEDLRAGQQLLIPRPSP